MKICKGCNGVAANPKYKSCDKCRKKARDLARIRLAKRQVAGLCACGGQPDLGYKSCSKCRIKRKRDQSRYRKNNPNLYRETYRQKIQSNICVKCSDTSLPKFIYCLSCRARRWAQKYACDGITSEELTELFLTGPRCGYCGYSTDPTAEGKTPDCVSMDHIIPKQAGGQDAWDNLIITCWACNASKGKSSLPAWIKWCVGRGYPRPHPKVILALEACGVTPDEVV